MSATWKQRLIEILRWPAAAIGTLAASSVSATTGANHDAIVSNANTLQTDPPILPNTLNSTAADMYAAHGSHRSHASHRSGAGGVAPAPRLPPPARTAPTSQLPSSAGAITPSPADTSIMVVRAQAALMRLGYYNGDIDGILGPGMRTALTNYQKAEGLPQSGRMDIATLTKLGISIP